MAENIELDIPEYNAQENVITTYKIFLVPAQAKCVCCMAQNVSFVNLENCKHAEFLKTYYQAEFPSTVVCYICHRMLSKIEQFKQQVQETSIILNNMFQIPQEKKNRHLSPITKINNLQLSTIDITTAGICLNLEPGLKLEHVFKSRNENPQNKPEILTEVKIEIDGGSDFEIDTPLSEIKAITDATKKKVRKNKKNLSLNIEEKYRGKIQVLILSRKEMMEERDRESKKESYLKLPYKCETCIKGFDHELTLKNHNLKKHTKTNYDFECNVCKSVLSTEFSYKEHCRRHLRRYECVACGKRGSDMYTLANHYNQRHREEDNFIDMKFSCDQCDFTTESHRIFRYHRDKHKHKDKHKCTICGNTFVNPGGLKMHMLTVHKQSKRVFACDQCDKVYNSKTGFLTHKSCTHGGGDRAFCVTCRKHYTSRNGLQHHLRRHSAHATDKRFICDECGAKFLYKKHLEEHIDWKHLNIQHKCNKCNKGFASARTLKVHVQFVHEKKRPPRNKICDYCGKGFTTQSILRSHIRTHTGERPLSCTHCAATFAHSGALYIHKKLLHKGKT